MKILITGAGGFLGRGLVPHIAAHGHELRLMDPVTPAEKPTGQEWIAGDVADPAQCAAAMEGMNALIIGHMAPRGEANTNYQTPELPFAINVTGVANLLHAAKAGGVKRVVLISSTAVTMDKQDPKAEPAQLPLRARDYYGLSKLLQEVVAEHFARTAEMQIACLRIGYVLDGETNVDKYGRHVGERNYLDTDRRDIAEVARLCLERDDLGFAVFNVMSTEESLAVANVRYTCERLGWKPAYDFSWLKEPAPKA